MRWWRLDNPVRVDLEKISQLVPGARIEVDGGEVEVTVKRGTAFCGRPLHVWTVTLRGRLLEHPKAVLTHWIVEEWHTSSPSTLGFELFFPEVVAPFKTPHTRKREIANDIALELEKTSRAVKLGTRFGEFWDIQLEQVKGWLRSGLNVGFYECPSCGRRSFSTPPRKRCSLCGSGVKPVKVSLEDLP